MMNYDDLDSEQEDAVRHLMQSDKTLMIAPQGFGKTVVVCSAINDLLLCGYLNKVLVIAPLNVCLLTWKSEYKNWTYLAQWEKDIGIACGTAKERTAVVMNKKIVVINYENLVWLCENFELESFDGLVIDETTKLKTTSGEGFKKLRYAIRHMKWRCGLSATPGSESMTDIFGQILLLDDGKRLGRNKDKFRRKYFYPTDYEQHKWAMFPGKDKELAEILSDIIYYPSDFGDSYHGEVREIVVNCEMPPGYLKTYRKLARQSYLEVGEHKIVAGAAAVLKNKLHQFACGSVYAGDVELVFHKTKLEVLGAIRRKIPTPVVIAYQFDYELRYLKELYPKAVALTGQSAANRAAIEKDFNAGDISELLVHPKSASHGVNLQYGPCTTLIQLSPVWSADAADQLPKRLARRGQKSDVIDHITLTCIGTMEAEMYETVKAKGDEEKAFLAHIASIKELGDNIH